MSSIALIACTFSPVAEIIDALRRDFQLKAYGYDDLPAEAATPFHIDTEKLMRNMHGCAAVFSTYARLPEQAGGYREIIGNGQGRQ